MKNVIAILVCLVARGAYASSGTEGASFLNIPVGAGPASLGSAYTAMATNAYAPSWNPAGLGRLTGTELAAQHLSYLESMNYEYFSFVHPLKSEHSNTLRGLGFSMQYLGSGDIDRTDVDSANNPVSGGNPIGTFSSHYASYNMSYGQTMTEKLAVGITGKWINAKIDDVSASAYAADLGALYRASEKLQMGASLVNLGSKLKFISEGNSLPLVFKVGAAYQPNSRYVLTTEGVYAKTGLASFHLGGQWRPVEMMSLRAGYRTDTLKELSPLAGFSTGAGLHLWGQELAYAWSPYGDLGDTHYLSFLAHFGASSDARKNLIQFQSIKQHRTVREKLGTKGNSSGRQEADPDLEYQQLMQLLSADDVHEAQARHDDSEFR